jgi:hypothetical protein
MNPFCLKRRASLCTSHVPAQCDNIERPMPIMPPLLLVPSHRNRFPPAACPRGAANGACTPRYGGGRAARARMHAICITICRTEPPARQQWMKLCGLDPQVIPYHQASAATSFTLQGKQMLLTGIIGTHLEHACRLALCWRACLHISRAGLCLAAARYPSEYTIHTAAWLLAHWSDHTNGLYIFADSEWANPSFWWGWRLIMWGGSSP